jgi:hypothetical protein
VMALAVQGAASMSTVRVMSSAVPASSPVHPAAGRKQPLP